jgi:hypothetical protein
MSRAIRAELVGESHLDAALADLRDGQPRCELLDQADSAECTVQ